MFSAIKKRQIQVLYRIQIVDFVANAVYNYTLNYTVSISKDNDAANKVSRRK